MEINHLWEKLQLPPERFTTFKKDIAEGKVPELPFYIIGQGNIKKSIQSKIEQIDSNRMITNLIIAEYGNGKTNLLKYLELFFKTFPKLRISVHYSRADVERTDLILFLLKIVQDRYLDELIRIVKIIRNNPLNIKDLVNNYQSNFSEIKDYTEKLFDASNSDEDIIEFIYLGTGRLSNKRYFDKRNIEQLRDFNRREILVLFLNVLSFDKQYIIFAIDEIEKIREKSKIRFNHFLTSYRELVDLFNQIKGHYLIVCFTDSIGSLEIRTSNEALFTRIQNDIVNIEALKDKTEIYELIEYLNELFDTQKEIKDIYSGFRKKHTTNNRVAIQEISKLLHAQISNESLNKMLENAGLLELYHVTSRKLDDDDAYKNLHRKFFDPFEYYVESLGVNSKGLNKQDRIFIDSNGEKVHYFIFKTYLEEFENETIKITNLISDYPDFSIIVYSPIKLELTYSKLNLVKGENIEIIDFEPKELFALLVLYKDNFNFQPELAEIISNYTSQKL